MPSRFTGYAVFDLETTGLAVSRHHRVIEIGIVRLDEELDVVEEWETLVNPERDIGAGDIHGLTASDLRDAPTFRELATDVWHRFEGAIPVSHNYAFDRQFLAAEFRRAGVEVGELSGLCTMRLAGRHGLSTGARRLQHLCADLAIPLLDGHCAGNDARMCAEILKRLARVVELASLSHPVSCPSLWSREATALGITRHKARETPIESPLQLVARRLASADVKGGLSSDRLDEYLLILDRVIEDRIVTHQEANELFDFAAECGIPADELLNLHERYFCRLLALAQSDGMVTEDERRDLKRVSELLGLESELAQRLIATPHSESSDCLIEDLVGKSVCFTGELRCAVDGERVTREAAEQIAKSCGLVVLPRVTKKLDVLVVADPDSCSGKAQKAREYGVRIIAERAFWKKLGLPAT